MNLRFYQAITNRQHLVCFTRKEFELFKGEVFTDKHYLTHYYYKFSDVAMVGVCLQVEKENFNE